MARKRVSLRYRKERCILSDVLPYEIPLTFTNRHLYDFLQACRVSIVDSELRWADAPQHVDEIVKLLFALPDIPSRIGSATQYIGEKPLHFKTYNIEKRDRPFPRDLIPFGFSIDHKESEFRKLSIPHPRSQLEVIAFLDATKELIVYLCARSPYSIRRPSKVARFTYHRDRTHYDNLADNARSVEQYDKEYEHLRSFFVYRHYSNVYKFYESYRYHRCEKKYNAMVKLDISKCFDSIYTHSIAWALLGKDAVKEKIEESAKTFPGRFDKLMQRLNYGVTNGIIIGPEFSRVFAELILQSIDRAVESALLAGPQKLRHKVDYEMFRYVDDYFVFYNEPRDRQEIEATLQHSLAEYGLHLNSAKAIHYEKPIITDISRAKRQIANLLECKICYTLEELTAEDAGGGSDCVRKGKVWIDSKALIIEFKTIIKTCNVEYKDLLNYSLAIVENKCDEMLVSYSKADPAHRSEAELTRAILAVLEFVFFIYAVSPRVNTTIKLCRILRIVSEFYQAKSIKREHRHLVFKYVFDDIRLVLRKNKSDDRTQIETLYLLIAMAELGRNYWLEQDSLADYFNIQRDSNNSLVARHKLNYFGITVLLFYMKKKKRYDELRQFVQKQIVTIISSRSATRVKDTESTLLLFDSLSCPYIETTIKERLLELCGVADPTIRRQIIDFRTPKGIPQQWFTSWRGFDFGRELDRKKGFEVY